MRHLVELSVINNAVSVKKIVFLLVFFTFKIPTLTTQEIPRPSVYPVVEQTPKNSQFFFKDPSFVIHLTTKSSINTYVIKYENRSQLFSTFDLTPSFSSLDVISYSP